MEFEQLEAFLAVSQTKNFTKAAELLHIAQSTVTTRIKLLEEKMNKKLFERNNRMVELTPAGINFLPFAQRIQELMYEGEKIVRSEGLFEGSIVFGSLQSLWEYVFPPIISAFRKEQPKIALRTITGHSNDIIQKMMDGFIDIGVVYIPPHHHEIEVVPYFEDTIHLFAHQNFVIKKDSIVTEDFNKLPYIHMNWGSPFTEWYLKSLGDVIYPLQVDNSTLFVKMLLSGEGIGFLPEYIAKGHVQENQLKKLPFTPTHPIPKRPAYIIYPKRKKAKVEQLLHFLL
ncbi:DNA-binding transcriptional LysR family regulator [Bacillus oleivorans]|uniref:DNA-binding transcriptional LysR family regulator n=1 Tax=Bacillus oleivorans TaxID=1448271 RepID=A0A285D3L9_9BACI|nr:LysR family transcriptional regulator [Bacillus oleivorans]SNX74417.1 DNA-binding transcriptional LysR family regulator [Bacillus oleivorans]